MDQKVPVKYIHYLLAELHKQIRTQQHLCNLEFDYFNNILFHLHGIYIRRCLLRTNLIYLLNQH